MTRTRSAAPLRTAYGLGLATLAALGLAAPGHAQGYNTLSGEFYQAPINTTDSLATAQAYIAAHAPDGSFTASVGGLRAGYSGTDTSTPQAFLGPDGASYTGVTTGNLADGIFDMKGYIDVPYAGSYNFTTASDDGSALFIDGSQVVANPGTYSASEALSAGQHTAELVYYNRARADLSGLASLLTTFGTTALSSTPSAGPTPVDVFAPGDAITAVPASGSNEPGEGVHNAIDHNTGDKYLNFDGVNSGFIDTPQFGAGQGGTVVTGLQLVTGNDAPTRDPLSFTLEGSNDGGLTFTQITTGSTGLDTDPGRNQAGLFEAFANTAAYTTYEVVFPTLRDAAGSGNIMQVGEVELFGTPAPEPSQFAGLGVGVLGLAGLAFKARKRA